MRQQDLDREQGVGIVFDHQDTFIHRMSPSSSFKDGARRRTGKRISNRVPLPGRLSTEIEPPWLVMMPCTTDRPSPVPSFTALVVKNGSKARRRASLPMPQPLSITLSRTVPPAPSDMAF